MDATRGPVMTAWRRRTALRALARQIRAEDPGLARLLSGHHPYLLPPLRFTSVPPWGYAVTGVALLVVGSYLGVLSAVLWGLAGIVAAVVRRAMRPPVRRFTAPPGRRDRTA